ncbi:MAG: hypothetical protein ACTJHU_06160, partial [Mycetocola sp.]
SDAVRPAASDAVTPEPTTHTSPTPEVTPSAGAAGAEDPETQETADTSADEETVPAVRSSTSFTLFSEPSVYGRSLVVAATVTLDYASVIIGGGIDLLLNGESVGRGYLIYIGNGQFWTLIVADTPIPAGTHEVSVSFPGMVSTIPGLGDALPSLSPSRTISVAQAPTETVITSIPRSVSAFTPVDVSARVTSAVTGINGQAELRADGVAVSTAEVRSGGLVTFEDAIIPFGTRSVTAAFNGESGNYASSESEPSDIDVRDLPTLTTLGVSANRVTAGTPVTVSVTVENLSDLNEATPQSGFEILVDGESVFTEVSSEDDSPVGAGRVARFEATLTDLQVGDRTITARFLPIPGFKASESESVGVRVDTISTVVTPDNTEIQSTFGQPVQVGATVTSVAEVPVPTRVGASAQDDQSVDGSAVGGPVEGHIQAFRSDAPVGEPFDVVEGRGVGDIDGIPVGTHDIELRFVPSAYGVLPSSATVTVVVAEARVPDGGPTTPPVAGTDGEGKADHGAGQGIPTPDVAGTDAADGGNSTREAVGASGLAATGENPSGLLWSAVGALCLALGLGVVHGRRVRERGGVNDA